MHLRAIFISVLTQVFGVGFTVTQYMYTSTTEGSIWPSVICANQYIIHIFMQCALKIICVFSVIIHQNIDPKSTENPGTLRAARMHDFVISICCAKNHRTRKNTPAAGVF